MLFAENNAPNTASIVLSAAGAFLAIAVPLISKVLYDRREQLRKERLEEAETKLKAESAEAVKNRADNDYYIDKLKEIVKRTETEFQTMVVEAKELQKRHHDCEIRLARAEERIALLEKGILTSDLRKEVAKVATEVKAGSNS